jgi:hypothetical protein
VHEDGARRAPAAEREGVAPVLQRRQARLEGGPRRVTAARVVEPQRPPRLGLREGRRQDDRLHHGAMRLIELLPRMDHLGLAVSLALRARTNVIGHTSKDKPRQASMTGVHDARRWRRRDEWGRR